MRHRHLDPATERSSVAAIDSIIERGAASDLWALLRELQRDPNGPVAAAAWAAAERSPVYGYPALIRACLEKWRHDRR